MPNVNPRHTVITCTDCRLNRYCLPAALNKSDIKQLEAIVGHNCTYEKGDHLYKQNDNFKSVYAVRSGSFKSYAFRYDGKGRVNGFFFSGEISSELPSGGLRPSLYWELERKNWLSMISSSDASEESKS